MTKLTKRALLVVLAIVALLTLTLTACQSNATVTFVGGEGATGTAPDAITAKVGDEITLPANTFTKEGWSFAGWKIGDKTLKADDKYTLVANVEAVAQWTKNGTPEPETWTVTFKNGDNTVATVNVTKGQKLTAEQIPAAPTVAADKEFKGWFVGDDEITVDTTISSNITAVAKIDDKPLENISITYKAGEGTGDDVVVTKSKGMAFNLATASDIGSAFTAPATDKMIVGWKLQGDASGKVYGLGEEYTAQAASTFIAQWGPKQATQYDTTWSATLVLSLTDNTGMLYIDNEGSAETEVSLTYTRTDTALSITIAQATFNGTWDDSGITITLVYQSKSYVFQPEHVATDAPTVTFNANGGSGTAPQIGELTADNIGYKLVLPENTFIAPAGKEFKEWNIVINDGKDNLRSVGQYIYLNAGETVVVKAVWKDAEVPSVNDPITFVGNCTVPTKSSPFGNRGGQTYVKFVVDVDALKVTYYISTDTDGVEKTAQDQSTSIHKPATYGSDALYLEVTMADTLGYYLLIKADLSELTLCDSDDEPITNGVFTAEQGEDPTPTDKTLADYEGYWLGEISIGSDDFDLAWIEEGKLYLQEGNYEPSSYTLTEDKTGANLVASYQTGNAFATTTITVTFTSDTQFTLTYAKTGVGATTVEATFTKTSMYTVTYALGDDYPGNEEAPAAVKVASGRKVAAPTLASVAGWKLLGWYAQGADQAFDFTQAITADITLTAHWEQITQVTVTFAIQTGVTDVTAPAAQTLEPNAVATQPTESMVRDGYRFDGWFNGNTLYDFATPVTADITLTAKWTRMRTITYAKPDGAEGNLPEAITVAQGESYTFIANPFTMDGYDFLGWKVGAGTGTPYKVGASISVNNDLTLTAVFGKVYTNVDDSSYTITLRTDNAGKVMIEGDAYDYEVQESNIWEIDLGFYCIYIEVSNDGTFVELDAMKDFAFTSTEDVQLTFDGKGGAKLGTIDGTYVIVSYDDNGNVSIFNLTIGGETYEIMLDFDMDVLGWAINVKITVDGTDYIFGTPAVEYTITFELGDGVTGDEPEDIKVMSNVAMATLPSGAGLTKSGYRFIGWADKTDPETNLTVNNYNIEVLGNMTLVPVWKVLYTLTYAAGEGATGEMPATEHVEGEQVTLVAATFTAPSGKKFAGWSDGTTTYKVGDKYTMPAQNATLTATWTEDGGSGSEGGDDNPTYSKLMDFAGADKDHPITFGYASIEAADNNGFVLTEIITIYRVEFYYVATGYSKGFTIKRYWYANNKENNTTGLLKATDGSALAEDADNQTCVLSVSGSQFNVEFGVNADNVLTITWTNPSTNDTVTWSQITA